MGYYLQIDTEDAQPLATNHGWGDVIRWAEGLSPKKAGRIHHFVTFGWEHEVDDLARELRAALKATPPKSADTLSTARNLLRMLDKRPDDTVVVSVTNGLGE